MDSSPGGGGHDSQISGLYGLGDASTENIVLIKPKEIKNLFSPFMIPKALGASIFKDHIVDTVINKRKGLIVLKTSKRFDNEVLEKCTKIGTMEVECFTKAKEPVIRHGVIHPIDTKLIWMKLQLCWKSVSLQILSRLMGPK